MKTKQLVLVALLAWGTAANAQEEKKAKTSFGFDVTNVSIGIGSGFSSAPDPIDFTYEEFVEHQASMIDIGISANVYGKWNVRAGVGYMFGVLDPEDYFDQVFNFDDKLEIWEYERGENFDWLGSGLGPGSNVLPYVGFSRSFSVKSVTLTPHATAWWGRDGLTLDYVGYEILATGEYVDDYMLGYEDGEVSQYWCLGLDVELDKYVLGLSYLVGEQPMPSLSLRLGYQL